MPDLGLEVLLKGQNFVRLIAPAVSKGNESLLNWINEEIKSLADEQFFQKDYDETLVDTYGEDYKEELVVEGGAVK